MTEEQFDEWLKTQPIEDKIVYLKYKYAHEDEWTFSNEILEVDMSVDGYYVWLDDWDEGQQDVEILGCIAISDIDVPAFTQADTPQTDLVNDSQVLVKDLVDDEFNPYDEECMRCKHLKLKCEFIPTYCKFESRDEPQTDYTPDCPFCKRYGTEDCLGSDCRHYKTYKTEPQTERSE